MKLLLYGLAVFALAMGILCLQSTEHANDPPPDMGATLTSCAMEVSVSPRRALVCIVTVTLAALVPRRCICEPAERLIEAIKSRLKRLHWPVMRM
jgi:hypothetical protein